MTIQSSTNPPSPTETTPHKQIRSSHLDLFFSIRTKLNKIPRQALFLAISIFDKYLLSATVHQTDTADLNQKQTLRVTACLWLAWKYLDSNLVPLKTLVQRIETPKMDCSDIVEMEAEILAEINFQIPDDTPYCSLIRSFQTKKDDMPEDNKTIAGQCLGFLKEAIGHSSDFSLKAELGANILSLYLQKSMSDHRIRQVCSSIHHKQEEKRRLVDG